jgi:hypothetical protein
MYMQEEFLYTVLCISYIYIPYVIYVCMQLLLLENGTPAPQSRSLNVVKEGKKQRKHGSQIGRGSILKSAARTAVYASKRLSSMNLPTSPINRRRTSLKVKPLGGIFSSKSSSSAAASYPSTEFPILYTDKQMNAVLTIQGAFRFMMARHEMARMKETMRPGEGRNANHLSGAVKLTWDDITKRLVDYLGDHFWEYSEAKHINILIIETWLAHLMKARTYFYDANGLRLTESRYDKTYQLEYVEPFDLTTEELEAYNNKKAKLNSLGVTSLLAKVLISLTDDISIGGLTDHVLGLFVELLDGGNRDVQQTLYEYLINVDYEGKFLSHIAKRISFAFGVYLDVKKIDAVTRSIAMLSHEVLEACEHLTMCFRFLQLLCEGHHLGFQKFLHSSTQVNLIKICVEHVILLCDSTSSITKLSTVEVSLITQVKRERKRERACVCAVYYARCVRAHEKGFACAYVQFPPLHLFVFFEPLSP